uniref:Major facilitator superfamily associated domain-containing protein n=1 Tax=Ascaris lumbricoides TaxID=6252 RepID=A0A9J2PMQ5_ASCLU
MIECVLSLLATTVEIFIFCSLWVAFVVGVFVISRATLRARFSPLICDFLAFAFSSSTLFELFKMNRQRRLMQKMFLENGPPIHCSGFSWLLAPFSSYSCLEYYETVHSNIFWQLNVFFVTAHLFSDISVAIFNIIGRSLGGLLNSYINELHMFYRIPGFIIASICILSLIFALLGCRFSIGYGFIQIDFRRETALRSKREQINNIEAKKRRKFVECERMGDNNVRLIYELYQKCFASR